MSRRFEFPLQKVLDIRRKLEDHLAAELQHRVDQRREEEAALEALRSEKAALLEGDSATEQALGLGDIRIRRDYLSQLDDRIVRQRGMVEKCLRSEEAARQKLLQASHDKRMVEKLRERSLADYRRKQLAVETRAESEVALRIAMNRKREDERE